MSNPASNATVLEMRAANIGALRDASQIVVEEVSWSVLPGEFWVVAGPQRSGKSDLLLHAAGLMLPAHGSCRVFGRDTADFDESQVAERLRTGFVFAGGKLFNQLTIAENVALPLRYQKNLSAADATREVESLLEIMELPPFADSTPANLAANWRLRAALARALVLQPELLLLDQPLAGLGGRHRQWLLHFLDRLWRGHEWFDGRPMTVVVTTDDLRSWRSDQRKFALLDGRKFFPLGSWREMESAREPHLKELLAELAGATM
jgi:ABC-type transporter Mla maintaining outer membrane lipid asymmetry ATPase subunit MlaF